MIIAMACDHAGYPLKITIKEHLKSRGIDVIDLGTDSEDPVDYPIYGKKLGEYVAAKKADLGVAVCGTGIGISMACNKVKGIRCALCTSVEMGQKAKQHNNANILALGGRTTDPDLAVKIVDAWLGEKFLGQHHTRRIEMLDEM